MFKVRFGGAQKGEINNLYDSISRKYQQRKTIKPVLVEQANQDDILSDYVSPSQTTTDSRDGAGYIFDYDSDLEIDYDIRLVENLTFTNTIAGGGAGVSYTNLRLYINDIFYATITAGACGNTTITTTVLNDKIFTKNDKITFRMAVNTGGPSGGWSITSTVTAKGFKK